MRKELKYNNKNIWPILNNQIQDNKLLKWLNNKKNLLKIKYLKNLDNKNKEEEEMLNNLKISEDNFINNNHRLKLEKNKQMKLKKEIDKNQKCKMLKDKRDKENKDKNKKKKGWKKNLDNQCQKNSQDKIKLNKWRNKKEE